MNSNHSNLNTLPTYKLYFDDIEEIFFNTVSFKFLLILLIITWLLTIASLIILLYRSTTIFLGCFVPFIYSLVVYDFTQMLSIILLKFNLMNVNDKYYNDLCRWPYYLKASSEAGQCLTLIFIYAIRCQKVRYFLKHNHLPNSSPVHSRALTFVCLLFIVYVNNWITHLKVEKIHLITWNESNYEINIQEYPLALYGIDDMTLNDSRQFYLDFDKYAQNYGKNQIRQNKSEKIIHNQKDDSFPEVVIKIPYNIFGQRKSIVQNRTRRKTKRRRQTSNKTNHGNNSYRVHRCTYGQRNFFLVNFLSLIHNIFYFLSITYFLTTIYRHKIPYMTVDYHQKLCDKALITGRRKSAERHKQLMLLTHLRHFQYLIVYCHTTFTLIRLMYECLLTFILCLIQSPFKWLTLKIFFNTLFFIVYYTIPIRITLFFLFLFVSLFSPYIYSIFYYVFHTKLHFSCKFQKPTIRFRLHIVQCNQREIIHDERSTNSLVLDLTSSVYDEHSTMVQNESTGLYEENSITPTVPTTTSFAIINQSEQSEL